LPELSSTASDLEAATGCRFRYRCPWATEVCEQHPELAPPTEGAHRLARCLRTDVVLASDTQADVADPGVVPGNAPSAVADDQVRCS
jgi:hypothetical protein